MIERLGLQLYTVRDFLGDEELTRETLRKLLELGYSEGQTANENADPVLERVAREEDFKICGSHTNFARMLADPDGIMEEHDRLGTKNIGIGGSGPKYRESLAALCEFTDLANDFAAKVNKYGFKFTYHHHSVEFGMLEGRRIMDVLVERLDPVTTSFVLDTYWIQHGGGSIVGWLRKLAGRVDILHLKDMAVRGFEPYITEVGQGNIDFHEVIAVAEEIGVKHYVVEQDSCPGNPLDSVKISSEYIHANFMKN